MTKFGRHCGRFFIIFSFFWLEIDAHFVRVLSHISLRIPEPWNKDLAFGRLIDECTVSGFYSSQKSFKIDLTVSSRPYTMLFEYLYPLTFHINDSSFWPQCIYTYSVVCHHWNILISNVFIFYNMDKLSKPANCHLSMAKLDIITEAYSMQLYYHAGRVHITII